jgi:hypothetical protein
MKDPIVNFPTLETIFIMKVSLRMSLVTLVKLKTVLNQHYYQYDGHLFKSECGVAVGLLL